MLANEMPCWRADARIIAHKCVQVAASPAFGMVKENVAP